MSRITIVSKKLEGLPLDFTQKMDELSGKVNVSWDSADINGTRVYQINIFWYDSILKKDVAELLDTMESCFKNPYIDMQIFDEATGIFSEEAASRSTIVEEKMEEEPKVELIQENVKEEIHETETVEEKMEEEPKVELIQENVKEEIHETETVEEKMEEEPKVELVQEAVKKEIHETETVEEKMEEEPKVELVQEAVKEEIHETETVEEKTDETNFVSSNDDDVEEASTPEENKAKFIDLILSKLPEDLDAMIPLDNLCSDLNIVSKTLKYGIFYSDQVKTITALYQRIGTDLRKNPKVVENNMKSDFEKWLTVYPDDTPKNFKLTIQEFINIFRRGLKPI